jgi:hypothetical protein
MTTDVVIFPDAVAVVVGYLRDQLSQRDVDAVIAKDVPKPRPDNRLVVVKRGGGVRQTVVSDGPLLIVECWAARSEDAHDLAQLCRGLLHAMAGTTQSGVPCYRVDDAGGVIDLPDPLSTQPRYTFTVQAHLRGAAE